jgi:hypothetical protein
LTNPQAVAIIPPHLVAGGHSVKKRSLLLKIIVIANALVITGVFVGCPGRQEQAIMPAQIAPVPLDRQPPPPPLINIAPYGGNFQHILPSDQTPPAPSPDAKNDKRSP